MKRIEPGEARIILKNSGIPPNNVVGKIRKDSTQSAKTFMGYDLKDEDSRNGLLGVVVVTLAIISAFTWAIVSIPVFGWLSAVAVAFVFGYFFRGNET